MKYPRQIKKVSKYLHISLELLPLGFLRFGENLVAEIHYTKT